VVWASAAIILIFGIFPDAIVSFTQRSEPAVNTQPRTPAGGHIALQAH